ncbi:MAG: hypothetical protein JO180_06970 [Gemmatirosa sp.]|nr:hypothetical protein [Gemmatirosa sp.]
MSTPDRIRSALALAAQALGAPEGLDVLLTRPRDRSFGDWTTNVAMTCARSLGRPPRDVAARILDGLRLDDVGVASAEIAGNGFINFRLEPERVAAGLACILERDERYGRDGSGAGRGVAVSIAGPAPRVPLDVRDARALVSADAIVSLLAWTGWAPSRRFVRQGGELASLGIAVGPDDVGDSVDGTGCRRVELRRRALTVVGADTCSAERLVGQVGRDAVRFFFLQRRADAPLAFDVPLARAARDENPLYRIQLAHARMSGMLRMAGADAAACRHPELATLTEPMERPLIAALVDFPRVVVRAGEALAPHRIARYLLDTATLAHAWHDTRLRLGDAGTLGAPSFALARATQIVLRNGLTILGISAPDRM